jgi:hypothetical protein
MIGGEMNDEQFTQAKKLEEKQINETSQVAVLTAIIIAYNIAADKFIAKCNDGRARSKETLSDLSACRDAARNVGI